MATTMITMVVITIVTMESRRFMPISKSVPKARISDMASALGCMNIIRARQSRLLAAAAINRRVLAESAALFVSPKTHARSIAALMPQFRNQALVLMLM